MEEGDFFVFWFGEDALKPHHTQPPQCRIPYCYVTPREDAPGKMTNIELEVQMAATVVSIVRSSQASPSEPCRGLQGAHRSQGKTRGLFKYDKVTTPWPCCTSVCIAADHGRSEQPLKLCQQIRADIIQIYIRKPRLRLSTLCWALC